MGDLTANLSRSEFACRCGCGFDTVDIELARILQETTDHFFAKAGPGFTRASITINSGCRCPTHNAAEGGSKNSRHMKGNAADFKIHLVKTDGSRVLVDPDRVAAYLDKRFKYEYGVGWYNGRTHFDTSSGGKRRWDCR